ncbi:hypothetical protein BGX14_2956 [Fibrobacter sp. UWS1]|nr:hypothetical protein BGX14_2956 [Fibrobacter sp. UWS1]
MLWGVIRNFQSWFRFAPAFLGVKRDENLNTKETHVGMNGDVILDRSSTLLTSTLTKRQFVMNCRFFYRNFPFAFDLCGHLGRLRHSAPGS